LLLIAALLGVSYGYWHLTNDARMREYVIAYLQRCTGGRVQVGSARFSLFQGINVHGLRLYLSKNDPEPFFEAPKVHLDHRPSSLLFRGRLEVTEIVCVGPRVTLVEDVVTERLNVMKLFPLVGPMARRSRPGRWPGLPSIRLRNMELVRKDAEHGQYMEVGRTGGLNLTLALDAEQGAYRLGFEGPAGTVGGGGTIDLLTGQTHTTGLVELPRLDDALPRKYRQWRRRYKLAGKMSFDVQARVGVSGAAAVKSRRLVLELIDVSMELPPDEGGLKLLDVEGELVFNDKDIEIKRLTGRIAGAGKAVFTLRGRYMGYEKACGFRTELTVTDLALPLSKALAGVWGKGFARLQRRLSPSGRLAVRAMLHREHAGPIIVEGQAELEGVSVALPNWPVRVEGLTGVVALEGQRLTLKSLRGRYGKTGIVLSGHVVAAAADSDYDLTLTARGLPFDKDVYQSLPDPYRRMWDQFAPQGEADFRVRFRRRREPPAKTDVELTILLTGRASLAYRAFPYRIHQAEGRVVLRGDQMLVQSVRGSAGRMHCVVDGWVRRDERGTSARLTVEATAVPLDETLARALPERYRGAYRACGLSGRMDVTRAVIQCRPGGPLDFEIPVALTAASLCHRQMPYRLSGVFGTVRVTPRSLKLDHLLGNHGRAKVIITGEIALQRSSPGLELAIEVAGLTLDSELRRVLPAGVRRWWDLFEPAGLADMTLKLRRRGAGKAPASSPASGPVGDRWDYHLIFRPRDLRVKYRHLPYALRSVAGTVDVVPGRMRLQGITAAARNVKVALDGEVSLSAKGQQADLKLSTGPVAIDGRLLAALPEALASALRLQPGGTVAVKLDHLRLRSGNAGAGAAAGTDPAKAATTQAGSPLAWSWTGSVRLADAVIGVGAGPKRVTGTLTGRMGCAGGLGNLEMDAKLELDSVMVGPRQVRRLSARLHKDRRSAVLKVDRLVGRSFGGRLDGFARFRLTGSPEYGLNLSVQDMDLNAFLNAGRVGPRGRLGIKGRLTGIIKMTGIRGDARSRRADGRFRITQGKLCKLPVLLGFLQLLYLTLPSDTAFHWAEVAYTIRGQRLEFQEITLRGSALSMVGAGVLDLQKETLKLTFLAGPPHKLPRVVGLSDVIEGIGSMFQAWRVTGTVSKPVIKLVPLANPAEALHPPGPRR